ncbi:MAG: acyl-CoA dehydrogenase family protein [Thermoplasmata archaeon]|nr:acyl-CoA dehydrogenase family protein [Thermoplasmata archaeon]
MDFDFDEEHELFRKSLERFVENEVLPVAMEIDEKGKFPHELFKKAGDLGYFGLRYPAEYGGTDADSLMFCILCEELARGSLSFAAGVMMQAMQSTHFPFHGGTEEQKQKFVVPAIKGAKVGAFALTEPDSGSDLGSIRTSAVKDGDGYVLNGTKTWATNAQIADFFTVMAVTDKEKKLKGVDFFLVERDTPGFTIGKDIQKLGLRGTETAELAFEDCRIPGENRLGEEGTGYDSLMAILAEIRIMTGALALGLGRSALDMAVKYANERVQFGRPVGKFQAIRMKLADVATELEASKWMVYNTAWLLDKGKECGKEAAMAKLFATEMAVKAADEASRVFGSYGFSMEYPIQILLRDARFLIIGGGTSEILKLIIGRELGL